MAAAAVEINPSMTMAICRRAAPSIMPVMAAISRPPAQRRISRGPAGWAKWRLHNRFDDAAFVRIRLAVEACPFTRDQGGRHAGKRGSHDAGGGGVADAHFTHRDQVVSLA